MNPISGTRRKQVIIDYINKVLGFHPDWEPVFYKTKCVGDACVAAKDFASGGFDVVVAIGGDGTVNEVAEGLINTSTKLAIIPIGSGNGLARHLNIPLNYQRAVDTIFNGNGKFIDAGVINGKVFFCTALAASADNPLLVTGNAKHYPPADFVVSPAEFCDILGI